jgi:soluble lytic murein transglycosylase
MTRKAAVGGLAISALLAWASVPVPRPLPELVLVGAGDVVPAGYGQVLQVMADRAVNLPTGLRRQLARTIAEEAGAAGFDPLLILAVIDVESDFELSSTSERGARGLMQIRPATLGYLAEQAGIDDLAVALEKDPTLDVRLGVRYLKTLKERFGSVDKALFAYNLGPAKMIRVRKANELGRYKGYLRAVKRDYAQLQRETGIQEDWTLASR